MSQFFQIHPENPQKRLIDQAIQIIRNGGVVAYPTDSGYALGCHLGDKKAIEKIKWLRSLDDGSGGRPAMRERSGWSASYSISTGLPAVALSPVEYDVPSNNRPATEYA